MNWVSRIFSNSDSKNDEQFRGLFVDNNPPVEEPVLDKPPEIKKASRLEDFLTFDYLEVGRTDGYMFHSSGMKEARIKTLKAEFCEIIDRTIAIYEKEFNELRAHKAEINGMDEEFVKPLDDKMDLVNKRIIKLMREKDLSITDEGWIQKPINRYSEGYLRGIRAYQQEKLLKSGFDIFND